VLALALVVWVEAFENVAVADFRRQFAFRREFQLYIFPRLAQVVVTIALALAWTNYWALVAGILIGRILQTIASYVMHSYRPRVSLAAWRDIMSFSFWSWLVNIARMIRDRGTTIIVGGMLGPSELGVFTVGSEVATLPETELIGPLSRACFAGFAAARRAGLSVADAYLRIVASMLVIAVPAGIGISSMAAPLVTLAFGAKWLDATPVVEILAISGIFAVIARISSTLLSAFGLLRPLLWNAIAMATIEFVLLIPFVWHAGIAGAAIAATLALLIEQITLSVLTLRRFAIRPADLLSRIWRCLLASAGMAAFLAFSGLGWAPQGEGLLVNLRQLLLISGSGMVIYTAVLLLLWLASGRPSGPEMDVIALLSRYRLRMQSLPAAWRRRGAAFLIDTQRNRGSHQSSPPARRSGSNGCSAQTPADPPVGSAARSPRKTPAGRSSHAVPPAPGSAP
jgi:O-antigen/teichoic acid export membrane protein